MGFSPLHNNNHRPRCARGHYELELSTTLTLETLCAPVDPNHPLCGIGSSLKGRYNSPIETRLHSYDTTFSAALVGRPELPTSPVARHSFSVLKIKLSQNGDVLED